LFGFFVFFFSFKVIFKLKVVRQNIVQTLNLLFFYGVQGSNPGFAYIYALSISTELSSRRQKFEFIMN